MTRVAVLFHRLGPYHHARLCALQRLLDVTAIELSAVDDTYRWAPVTHPHSFRRMTLFHERDVVHERAESIVERVEAALDEARPQAVAIPGWSDRGALAALGWCARRRVPAVMMSDSTAFDERRRWWKEEVKKRILVQCQAGLAAGRPHVDYLAQLGMSRDRLLVGYDVVDNDHFWQGALAARRCAEEMRGRLGLPDRYFLASNRFIPKKNLPTLFHAYARYRAAARREPWKLVLLGDGALRDELLRLRQDLNLVEHVFLPGFKQYEELTAFYGLAGAFIHASTTEQWGLVVNEAMAAGLPILLSRSCGCATDLLEEGKNGFLFDPYKPEVLAELMRRLADGDCHLKAMGDASREIIDRWTPQTFAENLSRAIEIAERSSRRARTSLDRGLLWSLIRIKRG